ncbi:hypothetical protein PM082_013750 [Marasmius tenuissimus]|nr:hypothetical protein PM082_013746 [Marasmius tenuissimus]KAJ8088197.1 hypothetical protein PM082_013748 [Marasmius tenuissimus]KAJ8088199.1 hypothetical protein PM082_013750 [Marasmius tenuissimus]
MSPTPSRTPTPARFTFTTPRPDENIPEYDEPEPTVDPNADLPTKRAQNRLWRKWDEAREQWEEEQKTEVEKRIAEWEAERAELERGAQEWKVGRDARAEDRKKQKEADEEEVRRRMIPEPQVKPEFYSFSNTDIESLDWDWERCYPLLTSHQQMVFQAGFAAGRKAEAETGKRKGLGRKGKGKEVEVEITDPAEVGTGPLNPTSCKTCIARNAECRRNEDLQSKSEGGKNACFRCRIKKGKCSLARSGGGARSEGESVMTEKTKGSGGGRKGKAKEVGLRLTPDTEKALRQINRGLQLLLAHWGVPFDDSSEEEDEPAAEPEDTDDQEEGPSTRPSKRPASKSPKNTRKKVKSAETIPEDADGEEEDEDRMKE